MLKKQRIRQRQRTKWRDDANVNMVSRNERWAMGFAFRTSPRDGFQERKRASHAHHEWWRRRWRAWPPGFEVPLPFHSHSQNYFEHTAWCVLSCLAWMNMIIPLKAIIMFIHSRQDKTHQDSHGNTSLAPPPSPPPPNTTHHLKSEIQIKGFRQKRLRTLNFVCFF
jgi:hypothetical protein